MLADIFPTGWHATESPACSPGETVVVYGAGPVGLMAAYSAMIKGASKVMVVDRHPDRLRAGREDRRDRRSTTRRATPVEQVLEQTNGHGADRGCECVGYQAHDPQGHEHAELTLNNLVSSVRFTGRHRRRRRLRAAGPRRARRAGAGRARSPSTSACSGSRARRWAPASATVKRYNRHLRDLIHAGRAQPSFDRLARAAAGRGARRLRALRPPRRRLDQGPAPSQRHVVSGSPSSPVRSATEVAYRPGIGRSPYLSTEEVPS